MELKLKKGDKAVLVGFTGIRLSDVEVTLGTKTEIQVTKKDGSIMKFDRKTGVQTNAANEKYANKIMTVEDAPAAKEKKPATPPAAPDAAAAAKKPESKKEKAARLAKEAAEKAAAEADEFDDDEDDDDEYDEV